VGEWLTGPGDTAERDRSSNVIQGIDAEVAFLMKGECDRTYDLRVGPVSTEDVVPLVSHT
jgi:hypothetical protein